MPHPTLDNQTAFHADALHLVDEDFQPLLTPVVRASFDILPGGSLAVRAEQRPLEVAGIFHEPDVEPSSYRYEPEVAPFKLATDVAFVGHAVAPNARTTQMDVGVRVGPLVKSLRVFGDRVWFRSMGEPTLTSPATFERMPITYERAFGGWDRSAPEPIDHEFERRNPVGRGFHTRKGRARASVPAPNIEDIASPIRSPYDTPPPMGLGFVSPDWQPRASFAGTYDDAWKDQRFPLLPTDFDRRFHSAGSAGLVASGYLRGDEHVSIVGMVAEGRLGFSLPGVPPPSVMVSLVDGSRHQPPMNLDTVIVDLDERVLVMMWRTSLPLPDGPHDVRAIELSSPESLTLPRSDVEPRGGPAANQATNQSRQSNPARPTP
ncbi:DUF2169 family type VI secretion system accessory protein [Paraliomyxa miuraensis]|uniref:DUF2169 family type VI secretion system accessory protein n=1 Tax=Paraliomyxa miuraensis TaxID=376150 RepID=UPI00224F32E1|nr:DUF2169 domain-containing protein [Paraliomyxa miuraensis]MCX4242248.1 DUF2169 domain-containing protein [Paraliomyxa miuraensis]